MEQLTLADLVLHQVTAFMALAWQTFALICCMCGVPTFSFPYVRTPTQSSACPVGAFHTCIALWSLMIDV